jgi:amino acid adenylation domain-containing protein
LLLITDPKTPTSEPEPLPQTAWNDTAAPLPVVAGVHELVEAQVERTPDAVAAELGAARLSYRELNERANRIAHRLRSLGVGPEVLVGICMERSLDAVAAILGVLKAGGAYVPLDPAYPRQRLGFMLEDAAIRVLLTQRSVLSVLPEVAAHVVCLDDGAAALPSEPSVNLERTATRDNLAYVIYTSGSTGRSKGVAMPHLPLINLVEWQLRSHAVPGAARTLHFASMSFDVSFQEIFSTWSSGGALIIVPEDARRDLPALARLLAEREVERAFLPPIVLQHLAEAIERGAPLPTRLREIIAAGEALRITAPIAALLARLDGCALQNHYGPTETHVVTAFTVPSPAALGLPSIGKPIANTQVHVLDEHLAPVPVGVFGELYLGGMGLARGYLGRPELTSARFVSDPFNPIGARLYRTGDRGRWCSDGTIEFQGRVDHQVKIRGYRIELGEIEAALLEHPAVRSAVVAAREDAPGDKRLVAYVVAAEPSSPAAGELRGHLQAKLPEYMVPAAFVWLDAIPLLPNGKTDRASLPAPPVSADGAFAAPRTPVEEVIANIWADVLRRDRVGVGDEFLALGGHSLHATQVMARVVAALGIDLPVRALFEAPTVALLAERVEAARQGGGRPMAPPIVPVPREDALPLSYAQQLLWLVDQLDPGSAAYNIFLGLRVDGPLDQRALERSLREIVRRHEVLRTTFAMVEGDPRQVIAREPSLLLPVVDLEALPEAGREAEMARLAQAEARLPFDLARGPLFRATLLRLNARSQVLLLTMHHIVSDGWSLGILTAELSALYQAFSSGRLSPLPDLPIQVADHSQWQRAWLVGAVLDEQIAYWKEQLRGAPAALELPTDRPRPTAQSFRGATHRFLVPRELAAALSALSRRAGVTLFMTLLASFQVLLHRHSGQDDIVVGSPIAGRTRSELEDLIGFFVNTLVLRTNLGGEPTFLELLARVREVTLGAYAHQDVPFEKLLEALAPVRELGRTSLFQVMLVLENAPGHSSALGDASLSPIVVESATAKFDLLLSIEETADGLNSSLEYATDLFDTATIARMAEHFRVLLEGVVADPARRVSELPILTEPERRQLLVAWNDMVQPIPEGVGLHQLFEHQADLTPDAIALVDARERLTYRQLEAWSNAVGHRLRTLGVGPGALVGVSVHRSAALVAAMLGILKAGAAYVPLDPTYPKARLAQIVEQSRVAVIVVDELATPALPAHAAELVPASEPLDGELVARLETSNPARDLAYVLFTSGSTGTPKGVAIEHRSAVALVAWARRIFSPAELAGVLFSTSIAFDLSVFEVFVPLAVGGTVLVAQNALELPKLRAAREVTLLNTVPSAMTELLRMKGVPTSVRTVCLAGEPLTGSLAAAVHAEPTIEKVYNLYGPTEATTYATFLEVRRDGSAPTIGRPIANTTAYILGPSLEPVPIGVTGEIHLGGAGLARGYLHQPEMTQERFIPSPFVPGERLYRTGDLGRFRIDGEIEYLGRRDHQIKLRGFRIELGEIESVLREISGAREVVVVLREDQPGDKRLVAYVVLDGDAVSVSALREHLVARLPAYMVPAAFVMLEALPLTPNGKLDRRALPRPEVLPAGEGHVAARTPTEEVLAGIWADVLRLDHVNVEDDFFALGGHSLLGTRVISRVTAALGVELPLRAIFEAPTIARMAGRIEAAREQGARLVAPPIVPVPRDGALPLSYAQQRLWLLDQLEPGSAAYNMPASVRLEGALDAGALERCFAEITRRHEALRTTFATVDGEPHQIIAEASFSLPMVDLASLPEAAREPEARRLAAEEGRRPFDLSRGPLFRATLIRVEERVHVLLTTMHHVVSDGWSNGVFGRELAALYEAFSAGHPSPLPELRIQYADYAVWQRDWLAGGALDEQVAYWKRQLGGAPSLLEVPAARPRPRVQTHHGAAHAGRLPHGTTAALRALCQREGVTLFMALLAAFQALLGRYSGQDDIVVGSPIAGRTRAETEQLIGFFLNTLALRTSLAGEPTFRELCARVREVTLGAYAHQDVPFERVIEALVPPPDLGRTPLFQAYFNLLNLPSRSEDLVGLTAQTWAEADDHAKFDLNLYAEERDGGIDLHLVYNTDLFDALQMRAMLDHLTELVCSVVADPDQAITRLPLSLPAGCAAPSGIVEGRPGPRFEPFTAEATEQSIGHRFEEQASRRGPHAAIRTGGREVSYAELDAFADRVASAISAASGRVALLFEPGPAMIAAILGALKAAATYVPLDLASPPERLAAMIEDAGAAALLTHAPSLARARSLAPEGCPVIDVDTLPPAPPLHVVVSPDTPAYILYTSGSTGRPKGVVQSHRNVLSHIRNYVNRLHLDASDVLSLVASYAFDAAVMDIFGALLCGATLCPVDLRGDGLTRLPALLREHRVSVYHSTPTVFRHLAGMLGEGEVLQGIRLVVLGGEEAQARDVEAWRAHFAPDGLFVNGLGPTESTLALQHFVDRDTLLAGNTVPVGHPVEGVLVRLVTPMGEQVALWGVGEIELRSAHVALGYWNRPDLTEAAFAPDPTGGGRRIYRTGDVGRLLPDGALEHLGRVDHQVKVRGHRIELGEIEARILGCPGVARAVVAVREGSPGEKSLAAYVVPVEGAALAMETVREHLRKALPAYMLPAAFMRLDALPLLPNGKVDRRALPMPDGREEHEHRYVPPRTPAEEVLAGIWAEVLRRDRVGVDDDFFALGGHSLLATQMLARVRAALGVELPLRALFEAPTIARLAERVEAAREQGARPAAPPLVPMPRESTLPLSYAQQRLWLIDQLEPGSATYNIPLAMRLDGALDAGALERSLVEILRRHEALRTTFTTVAGEPRQVIAAVPSFSLPVVDLASLPEPAREAESQRLAIEDANRPFDLSRGPLLRAALLRLEERAHVLLLNMHHVVSDGWSIGVLTSELTVLYEAFSAGRPSPLPELRIQYTDYALWQREWLSGEVLAAQLAYWKEHLRGAPAALDLPLDRPRPAVESHRGAMLPILLPRELSTALGLLSRREGVTLFMTLLAAFQVLLHRHSGQDDIVVGSPIAGRTRVETEGLIGFLVNTLVLRGKLGGDPTFRELLAQVRESTLGAHAHQDVPFEKLVEELAPPRDLGRAPLFQAMLILQNAPASPPSLGDVSLAWLAVERTTAKFDLTLSIWETAEGLAGALEYATDLFDAATMARMAGHLQALLEGAVADPGARVSDLPLLTEPERCRLLVEWNDTKAAYPQDHCIHELFEAQVETTPEATALIFEGQSLGYRELDARANRLAHRLIALGAGPGALVGLALERSPEMVVGLLGILKAGAAYVPLDPTYPADRLAFMIEDAGLGLLVSEGSLAGALPEHAARVVVVDAPESDTPDTSPGRRARGEDVAYVIYTSGSTGRPKGVEIPHRAVVNFLVTMRARPGLTAADRLLAVTSLSFDIAVLELFLPLVVGAQVDIVTRATAMDGAALRSRIEQAGITVMQATPSTWRLLLDAGWPGGQGFVALVGGEAVPRDLVNALAARAGSVWNMYGPTETTIWSCIQPLTAGEGPVSIGRPIANTRALVLDRRLALLPVGVPGELYLGGAGLARGYLGRPELTGERFIDDPFLAGERLFRTGDLCRFRADGTLECLGRLDYQVKLRGHRIELGEIEAVLAEHPAVRQAVVTVREDTPGDRRLIAYLVAASPASKPAPDELRRHLQTKLPDYMIPATFVALEAIPLTPNGKIDHRSLPAPAALSVARGSFRAPRTLTERVLAGIWADLLGLDRVGIDEDFFALGGHSMLAVRVFGRIQERFGKSLPIATLFQAPTIEKLADLLARDDWAPSWSSLIPISTTGSRRPFFCVHAFGGNVLNFRLVSRYLGEDQPFYGLQSRGLGGGEAPHERVEEMAAAYIDEMRAVQPRGPYAIGGSSSGGVIAYEMAQQLLARGERVATLVLLDTKRIGPPSPRTTRVFAASSLRRFAARLDHHLGNLLIRPPREGLAYLAERVGGRLGRNPTAETVKTGGPAIRQVIEANRAALRSYTPRPYPGQVVMLLCADEPDRVTHDGRLAWADLVEGLVMRYIPGTHENMLDEPQVSEVAAVLARCLDDRG